MKQHRIIASTLSVAGVAVNGGLDERTFAKSPAAPESVSTRAEDLLPDQRATVAPASGIAAPEQVKSAPENSPSPKPDAAKPQSSTAPITIVPPETLNPIITSAEVNNRILSHKTRWEAAFGLEYDPRELTFAPNVQTSVRLSQRAERQVTSDGLRKLDYQANYLLIDTPRTDRKLTVITKNDVETLGQQLQFSLTGSCIDNPARQCIYTPGLATDNSPEAAEPQTQNPIRLIQAQPGRGQAFDVATPENLAAIAAPGFQTGLPSTDARSQFIGNDFRNPNLGITDSKLLDQRRIDEISNSPAASLVRIRRILVANSDRAQLAQTVRGISLLSNIREAGITSNDLINTGIMGAAQILPDVRPSLKGTGETPSGANEKLFSAVSSVRLPANSFTAYHGGLATADNRPGSRQPFANFNSVWIGLSPLTDRTFQVEAALSRLTRTSTIFQDGAEGGNRDAFNFDVLFVNPDNSTTRLTPAILPNYYMQVYLDFFKSTGTQTIRTTLTERTRYVPSLAFTGSFANQNQAIQYFAGTVVDPDQFENSKLYVGAAYRGSNLQKRLGWSLAGQGVVSPDPDYYSFISGSIAKGWQLGTKPDSPVFFLSSSGLYSFDRPIIYKAVGFSPVSFLSVGGGINFGDRFPLQVTLDYTPSVFGTNGVEETLLLGARVRLNNRISLSGFYSPIAQAVSRSRAGAQLELALGNPANQLRLSLGWTLNQYQLSERTYNLNQFSFGIRSGG